MKIDLHAHTRHSDGTLTPTELIEESARRGVAVQAVTDHDNMDALPEALAAGARLGVRVVAGVELSTRDEATGDVHILGFFRGEAPPAFRDLLERQQARRRERASAILEKLRGFGITLTWEDLKACGAEERSVGRPHVARALQAKGFVSTFSEAFRTWLAPGKPAYVKHQVPTPEEGIRLIREAGGVAVVAHPGHFRDPALLPRLIANGLQGIETWHSDHKPEQRVAFAALAQQHGLVVTGGSDFHGLAGERYAKPGDFPTPEAEFARLEALWP